MTPRICVLSLEDGTQGQPLWAANPWNYRVCILPSCSQETCASSSVRCVLTAKPCGSSEPSGMGSSHLQLPLKGSLLLCTQRMIQSSFLLTFSMFPTPPATPASPVVPSAHFPASLSDISAAWSGLFLALSSYLNSTLYFRLKTHLSVSDHYLRLLDPKVWPYLLSPVSGSCVCMNKKQYIVMVKSMGSNPASITYQSCNHERIT